MYRGTNNGEGGRGSTPRQNIGTKFGTPWDSIIILYRMIFTPTEKIVIIYIVDRVDLFAGTYPDHFPGGEGEGQICRLDLQICRRKVKICRRKSRGGGMEFLL